MAEVMSRTESVRVSCRIQGARTRSRGPQSTLPDTAAGAKFKLELELPGRARRRQGSRSERTEVILKVSRSAAECVWISKSEHEDKKGSKIWREEEPETIRPRGAENQAEQTALEDWRVKHARGRPLECEFNGKGGAWACEHRSSLVARRFGGRQRKNEELRRPSAARDILRQDYNFSLSIIWSSSFVVSVAAKYAVQNSQVAGVSEREANTFWAYTNSSSAGDIHYLAFPFAVVPGKWLHDAEDIEFLRRIAIAIGLLRSQDKVDDPTVEEEAREGDGINHIHASTGPAIADTSSRPSFLSFPRIAATLCARSTG
ncbi:hypothetical protein FB451DRAFT_1516644 [Mycena latifolia]|nr:hypothetical protein FB451DRAFT_1516644 [Mycena latifolia]